MSKSVSKVVWRLRRGLDRRFRAGHPWVYSNELSDSPKGIEPGASVELCDAAGAFLARGYGNPASLIAFRALTRDPGVLEPDSAESVFRAIVAAGELRRVVGWSGASHRLFFGEADGIPGLVIDRYLLDSGQVFCVQAHTAGVDRMLPAILTALERYDGRAAVVLRNDLGVRKLEGLAEEPARVVSNPGNVDLSRAVIRVASASVASASNGASLGFEVDLIEGQKTGFFLDQAANVRLAVERFAAIEPLKAGKIRILDLCCYVGQWSAQFTRAFRARGLSVEAVLVDASAGALERARRNVEAEGASCETIQADVLKDLGGIKDDSFDLVIADPPALIKGRKDIPAGTHAYLQLNTQVFRLVRPGGGVVSCSCSALLDEQDFASMLAKAARRNRITARWVSRGGPSPDHPWLAEFPEGRYLKSWIGFVANSVQDASITSG